MSNVHPDRVGPVRRHGAGHSLAVPLAGLACHLSVVCAVLLAGAGPAGWLGGFVYGVCVTALLTLALSRAGRQRLGPADKITLVRSGLVGGVLALVIDGFISPISTLTLVVLATVAIVLDGVDGKVARRTGTASALGARFDMEVDAMLILILSVHAGPSVGWWVLLIGAARYLFLAAGMVWPWLGGQLPYRYWAKVVAVVQGVVLIIIAAGFWPRPVNVGFGLVALTLLTESFARSVWWLATHRGRTDQ